MSGALRTPPFALPAQNYVVRFSTRRQWAASSAKDSATDTLEKRLWNAASPLLPRWRGRWKELCGEAFKEKFEALNEKLETLNKQARGLAVIIAKNAAEILKI